MVGYDYDAQDHLVSVTDREGTVTSYEYSDRDLMTEEVSEVSGTTTYTFNEHGALETRTDARGIVETRTIDALDRFTLVDYPTDSLDIAYVYDDPGVAFSIGRLTAITRNGHSVDYVYDRFGRTTQDGQLTYQHDKNGNRTEIGYPGGEVARYTHDFADRQSTLEFEPPGGPVQSIVSASTYHPSGPVSSIDLGNGLTETRLHHERYHPARITLAPTGGGAALLDWQYTTDDVGNPTFIDDLLGGVDRAYGYQDNQYYLTQGDGPWGTLAWSYDRIGNRLTEVRDGAAADTYFYQQNTGAVGNTAKLTSIQLGIGGTTNLSYDAAGNQTQTNASGNIIDRTYNDAGRLSRIERPAGQASSDFLYDGRSFLRRAIGLAPDTSGNDVFCDGFETGDTSVWGAGPGPCLATTRAMPTYASEGVLNARSNDIVLSFAGRPVGLVDISAAPASYQFLAADHLGTPVATTDIGGVALWVDGLEPFGADWSGGASFLRFPGQWMDEAWEISTLGAEAYYNVHRWYVPARGSFTRHDPFLRPSDAASKYIYANAHPLLFVDQLGLQASASTSVLPRLVPIAGSCAADGPLLIGDALGIAALAGVMAQKAAEAYCRQNDCGDCSAAEHFLLDQQKKRFCKDGNEPRRCKDSDSPWQLRTKLRNALACVVARTRLDKRCFRGGDEGHQEQQGQVWRTIARCQELLFRSLGD